MTLPRTMYAAGAALLLAPVLAPAQPAEPPPGAAELEAYCERVACRRDHVVRVTLPDGRVQEETSVLHRPAITRNSLSVFLGEEITAAADFDDLDFLGWREARRRESSDTPVLTFRVTQSPADGSVSAAVTNRGRNPVKLRLHIRDAGAAAGEYTSSCPVLAGGTVYEYWARPVVEVIVREASLLTDDTALMCD
jgi:hypothetical protein